ncbi:uncharacterized protein LOC121385793 [Gigantopelta aegis]|uniref:uncharacterized protein LOC121385793 n=1 Tax=Gigantopelta aegis TaxID=1735272 RepID=UPI001B88DA87|nr:uncharacterized protein LOC121385793 [Gigantopelta aegis]
MFVCPVETIFDMISKKLHTCIIVGSFIVTFVTADYYDEEFEKLDFYTRLERGYDGIAHDLICKLKRGRVTGTIEIIRPGDKKLVLRCDNQFTIKSCMTVVPGYKLTSTFGSSYVMTIESFNPAVDVGMWRCRDTDDDESMASVNITSAPIFKVTENELPTQKNDSDGYFIHVTGACTFPVPVCNWKIMEVGESELKNPFGLTMRTDVQMCGIDVQVTCTVQFEKTTEAFLDKYLIFSVTICHPSIPGRSITPAASPVLFFQGVSVDLSAKNVYPALNMSFDLVCTVDRHDINLTGPVEFYRKEKSGQYQKFAHVAQNASECTTRYAPDEYDIVCDTGAGNLTSHKEVYVLVILRLRAEDYTDWYCYHVSAKKASIALRLELPKPDTPPDDPQRVAGGAEGTIIALTMIVLLIAAAVPAGWILYKRRKTQPDDKQELKSETDPNSMSVVACSNMAVGVSEDELEDIEWDSSNETVDIDMDKTQNQVDNPDASKPTKQVANESDPTSWR